MNVTKNADGVMFRIKNENGVYCFCAGENRLYSDYGDENVIYLDFQNAKEIDTLIDSLNKLKQHLSTNAGEQKYANKNNC